MLVCPKWLSRFLTPEEEDQLKDPSRRIFTYGLLASAAALAIPVPSDILPAPVSSKVLTITARYVIKGENRIWVQAEDTLELAGLWRHPLGQIDWNKV